MIKDYQREQEYQDSILDNRQIKDAEETEEKVKKLERKYIKVYDDPNSNPIRILKKLFKDSNELMVMCERTTGGHEKGVENISVIFRRSGDYYNS
eukprot:CAMPEP_0197015500 /NCGR_PEP_ID=MMETSP1380-20130617/74480_1 /TAXON_ID=5936 /ORGANISM="Euplotes crassus, Strain CT5" /LENGTH=94 /DNA_ID=CAMNT_0042441467 /DNA_START=1 /DNA_END=285 /DNA_ORIENTATION=-